MPPLPLPHLPMYHLIYHTAEPPPVRLEGVAVVIDDLWGHVANSSHTTTHRLAIRYVDSKTEI